MSGMSNIDPKDTHAIVVGVEKYAGGWDLDGPAADACKFVNWLRARGVVAENIRSFISPVDQNRGLLNQTVPRPQDALSHLIYEEFTENLARKSGKLLIVMWGGHGVIKADGTRRLFYADANRANMVNFDLNSALTALRSEYFQSFESQIFIVDSCAEYFELGNAGVSLPHQTLPSSLPASGRDQFVLLASRPGELAENLSAKKTGRFSDAVRQLLEAQGGETWPPDMPRLAADLSRRFTELRDAGEVSQTPSFFWYKDWNDNEWSLGTAPVQGTARAAVARRALSVNDKRRLMQALLPCPSVAGLNSRESVLRQLRRRIYNSIPRNPVPQVDVFNIVDTCLNYAGGMMELVEAVLVFDGDTTAAQDLDKLVRELMPEEFA
jgi:hypothetical protein